MNNDEFSKLSKTNKDKPLDEITNDRRDFIKKAGIAAAVMTLSPTISSLSANESKIKKNLAAGKMKFFIDTHDKDTGTFPVGITPAQMEDFYAKYESACEEEGVVSLRIHVGFKDGKAYCFNMAPNAKAVQRVHEKIGLPFESITEVSTITPADLALLS